MAAIWPRLHAEAIFSVAQTEAEGLEFAQDVRTRAKRIGRTDPIVFLPGLATMIGSTEAEVKQREQDLWELLPTDYGVAPRRRVVADRSRSAGTG